MALKKKITLPSGVSVEYWRLNKLFVDPAAPRVEVTFDGYLNAAARAEEKSPVEGASFAHAFDGDDARTLLDGNEYPSKAAIYTVAPQVCEKLDGATDC